MSDEKTTTPEIAPLLVVIDEETPNTKSFINSTRRMGLAFVMVVAVTFGTCAIAQLVTTEPEHGGRTRLSYQQRGLEVGHSGQQKDAATVDFDNVLLSNEHVFVDFYAPWCGYSQRLDPIWDEFTQQMVDNEENVKVIKINCDEKPDVCKGQGIKAYPTIRWYKGGKRSTDYKATRTVEALSNFARKQLGSTADPVGSSAQVKQRDMRKRMRDNSAQDLSGTWDYDGVYDLALEQNGKLRKRSHRRGH